MENYVLKDPIFPELKMTSIKRKDILELRERLKEKGLGDKLNTLNKTVGAVKAVFSEAYFRQEIPIDPGSKIGPIKEDRETRDVLLPEELRTLFYEAPGYWNDRIGYDFFFILANTGMRSGELRALKWDKWDRVNQVIQIHRSFKGNRAESIGLPKWDKIRDIPVSDKVAKIINSQPRYGEFVFSYPGG
ncbi:MAG: tyrosine-type recombinase/integrase, partial [Spirochaetales bacterium]|nr:tyrosine-type recombinase/integrase [Spirochaetales bacterium]